MGPDSPEICPDSPDLPGHSGITSGYSGPGGWTSINTRPCTLFSPISFSSSSSGRAEPSCARLRRRPGHLRPPFVYPFYVDLPNHVPHLHRTSMSLARASPGRNRRPYRRPPWECRPSSAPSRRSASPFLLHPNRSWEWIPGELLHLSHPFPRPFLRCSVRRARCCTPWHTQ